MSVFRAAVDGYVCRYGRYPGPAESIEAGAPGRGSCDAASAKPGLLDRKNLPGGVVSPVDGYLTVDSGLGLGKFSELFAPIANQWSAVGQQHVLE